MTNFEYETEERGFFQRFGIVIGIIAVVLVVGGVLFAQQLFSGPKPKRTAQVTEIVIRPLPPPPAAPPPPPPQKIEEKMEEQRQVDDSEEKPDDSPSAPADAGISTGIQGSGSDAFGLSKRGSGSFLGEAGAAAKRSHSKFGWYAAQVQRTLRDALQNHRRTRLAEFTVEVRIWPDKAGRIERAKLAGSTGDKAVDAALANEILPGLQLQEPPPAGMKLPIVLRFTAKRPT